jgi:hypothetical protein
VTGLSAVMQACEPSLASTATSVEPPVASPRQPRDGPQAASLVLMDRRLAGNEEMASALLIAVIH